MNLNLTNLLVTILVSLKENRNISVHIPDGEKAIHSAILLRPSSRKSQLFLYSKQKIKIKIKSSLSLLPGAPSEQQHLLRGRPGYGPRSRKHCKQNEESGAQ